MNALTQAELKEVVHYDPLTGLFTRTKSGVGVPKHKRMGGLLQSGYLRARVRGVTYRLHRLAFLYVEGVFPPDDVDHVNRVKTDNRWANLRHATPMENNKNMPLSSRNTSGHVGVYWAPKERLWKVTIGFKKRQVYIGHFKELHKAVAARKDMEKTLGFADSHGDST